MRTDRVVEGVVQALREREDELVRDMVQRFTTEVPELAGIDDPDFLAAMRLSAYANLRAGLAQMLRGGPPLPFGPPQDAIDEARIAAQAGVPLAPGLQTYRIGQSVIFDAVLEAVDATADLDQPARSAALRTCTQYAFAYIDAIIPFVTDEYTRERDRMVRRSEARRVGLVRDMLDGHTVDSGDLGYDLTGTHRAAIAWGPGADVELTRLAHTLGARLLIVPASGQTTWAWLGGDTAADDRAVRTAIGDWTGGLAFGRPAKGPSGARTSHREARSAQTIGLLTGEPVTHFDNVALESFMLADEQAARAFVTAELAPLDAGDGTKLRQTLSAYFASGFNAASAAAMTDVSDRTIANRLARIERLLGRPVRERQTELQVALRLERLLNAPAPDAGAGADGAMADRTGASAFGRQ